MKGEQSSSQKRQHVYLSSFIATLSNALIRELVVQCYLCFFTAARHHPLSVPCVSTMKVSLLKVVGDATVRNKDVLRSQLIC